MECPGCGTASSADQRFCAKCGTNLAVVEPPPAYGQTTRISGPLFADDVPPPPPPPPPPYPPAHVGLHQTPPAAPGFGPPGGGPQAAPSYDEGRGGRRGGWIVGLVAAAMVAALLGAGGVLLLLGDRDSDGGTASDTRTEGEVDRSEPPVSLSTAPASATEERSETEAPARFRCWDGGSEVERLAACTPPTGVEGMSWVFPSSTGSSCAVEAGVQRASEVDCRPVVAGGEVRFHYSEWRTRQALEAYYGGNTVAVVGAPGGRADLTAVQVESRDPDVAYKIAIFYADPAGVWSVTIYAADPEQYRAAVLSLDVRPFRQLRGRPAR